MTDTLAQGGVAIAVNVYGRASLTRAAEARGASWENLLRSRAHATARRPMHEPLDIHLRVLTQVCRAVELAQTQGVAHGALTPASVLVGDFDEVYVVGWQADAVAPNADAELRAIAAMAAEIVPSHLLTTAGRDAARASSVPSLRVALEAIQTSRSASLARSGRGVPIVVAPFDSTEVLPSTDFDPKIGATTRMGVAAFFCAIWTSLPVLTARYFTYSSLTLSFCVWLLLAAAAGIVVRVTMSQTLFNYRLFAMLVVNLVGQLLLVVACSALGAPLLHAETLLFLLWGLVLVSLAIFVDPRFALPAGAELIAFAVVLSAPSLRYAAMSATSFVVGATMLWIWRPARA